MPPKKCAACTKTVFPVEELKCLDKVWHKFCFKCQVCNMTLNMKNYKGYDKLPYCNAHYPETKFTAVADTPEAKRLAQNSKIQSNIKYHEEYEKERGQYTAVADDPETLRVKKNMETISNVAYHGDVARRQEMERFRPEYESSDAPPRSYNAPPTSYTAPPTSYTAPPQQQPRMPPAAQSYQSQNLVDYSQPVPINIPYDYRPPAQGPKSYARPVVTINKGEAQASIAQQPMAPPPQQGYGRRPGSVNDYDPMSGNSSSAYTNKPQSMGGYSSQGAPQAFGGGGGRVPSSTSDYDQRSSQYNQRSSQVQGRPSSQSYGDVGGGGGAQYHQQSNMPSSGHNQSTQLSGYAPQSQQSQPPQQQAYRQSYGAAMPPPQHQPMRQPQYNPSPQQRVSQPPQQRVSQPPQQRVSQPPPQQRVSQPPAPRDPYAQKGKVSRAIYDYTAADTDEISFQEGDIIIKCDPIDEGWMMGVVERNGQHGMLPSNYVEPLNW